MTFISQVIIPAKHRHREPHLSLKLEMQWSSAAHLFETIRSIRSEIVCRIVRKSSYAEFGESRRALPQGLQPITNFAQRVIRLGEQFAHGDKAVELTGISPVHDRHACIAEALCEFIAFVAQRISPGRQDNRRRQT